MNKFYLIILIFIESLYSQATIKGFIKNSEDSLPINSVKIYSRQNNLILFSNKEGFFEVKDLRTGKYNFEFSSLGYLTYHKEINLISTEEITLNIFLKPTIYNLNEVKVFSTRTDKLYRDESIPLVIIDQNNLKISPKMTVSDFLKSEPGISILKDGVWGTGISIRGLSRNHVVVLIDGNRVETATDIAANMSFIDPMQLERIEVIKGAGSLLYGTGALGGIVNIITKKSDFNQSLISNATISSSFNSVNECFGGLAMVSLAHYSWYFDLNSTYRSAKDIKTPDGIQKNTRFHDNSLISNIGIRPFENHTLKFSYQRYQAIDVGIPGASSLFPSNADVSYPTEKRQLISGEYEVGNISNLLDRILFKYSFQEIYRDVENIPNQIVYQNQKTIYNLKIKPSAYHFTNSLNLLGNIILSKNNYLLLGVDIWQRRLDSRREREQVIIDSGAVPIKRIEKVVGEKPVPDAKFTSMGGYFQNDLKLLNDKYFITFGGRIDKILVDNKELKNPIYEIVDNIKNNNPSTSKLNWQSKNLNNWSWSSTISMLYRYLENLDINLTLAKAFRSPSLEERFQYIDQGNIVRLGNPELKPEESMCIDMGLKYYGEHFLFQLNSYYNQLDNMIVEDPNIVIIDGVPSKQKQNIGKTRIYGYDLSMEVNLNDMFDIYVKNSFVNGEDRVTKAPLSQISPLNGKIGIKFNYFNFVKFVISSTIFAPQNRVAVGETRTPGYVICDLEFITKEFNLFYFNFNISGGIDNILNQPYINHLSSNRGTMKLEPGRNFFIKTAIIIK